MSIIDVAMKRYSTKSFDPTKTISDDVVEKLKQLLRYSPSSVNIQPWYFIIAQSSDAKQRMAKSTAANYAFNTPKILDASHVILFCSKTNVDTAYMNKILEQEAFDGRYALDEHKTMMAGARDFFVNYHRNTQKDLSQWLKNQTFINLGSFLMGAAALGVDAVPMEGMDFAILDREFTLTEQGLEPIAMVALGYRAVDDFNAELTKSRLPEKEIMTVI
ncbi:oxygen-insensitive NAD(P)H nitroreductase [Providencia vermicola]|uniref:Oxygen-insensitive NAD(P)H nitroreductase n=1 Tax=Providencia stuartii TaxID=588 RepID=A0AAI9I160_PROST|nr:MULTISPECIES: oxygen-insensitive NAD(P)H nitroreductase [Providencia]ELR5046377.1 oxygen-insensitive NAD(P)H nitroreductase [Providencia rettgeri]ELR5036330.1 oxygen-insensitive NAD(P)H nitroreductase [Providencia stuartii]ELR5038056.1 oxygen-insensitive NAD(P)H nitroreductase [Providencia stuartii]ELR5046648.1 oxygen-insensitive NAD(P)H nitroreductase [Providencia rettgeri]ELR5122017.1 oxygen-insensitive NAD(P)H nitroreductase [Providencia stuartii]